jgi:ribonucleoside-diphosphate reductase subunit M2
MVCVEGIMFQGAFCAIFWYGSRGLMKGLVQANSFIARDEALHTEFSILMYRKSRNHPDADTIRRIFDDAVAIASEFACDALPTAMECMNSELMTEYIKYVADGLAARIGSVPLYGTKNPFPFMEQINMPRQANFFETRGTEYARAEAASVSKYSMF